MAQGSDVADTRRTVFDAHVKREGDLVTFTVSADGGKKYSVPPTSAASKTGQAVFAFAQRRRMRTARFSSRAEA